MKILSENDLKNIKFKKRGSSSTIKVRQHLDALNFGEYLLIEKDDWTPKTPPSGLIGQMYRSQRTDKKFSVRTLEDDSGYIIFRVK